MLHVSRRWCVERVTREELIDRLAGRTWDLCAGFSCEDVLWLNDSIGHDSPQMFAAVSRDFGTGEWRQLDVFSVSWMARDRLRSLLDDLTIFPGWAIDAPQVTFADTCDCRRVRAACA